MDEVHVRISGKLQQGTEFEHTDDVVTVEGVTGVYSEEFQAVVEFSDPSDACEALLHVLDDNRTTLLNTVIPSDVIDEITENGRVNPDSLSVEASVTDEEIAYTLATRVAGRNQSDADILGEAAASVEGILLDFAMGRRGDRIDGLSAAARSALLTYIIDERSHGDTEFDVTDLPEA